MFFPLLLFGVLVVALTYDRKAAPTVGVLPPARPRALSAVPRSARRAERAGEIVSFEFGAPYFVVARTGELPRADIDRLVKALAHGIYHATQITLRPLGSLSGGGQTEIAFRFTAPKTEPRVPLGQPLDVDLGDVRARLILSRVERLDGGPVVGTNRWIHEAIRHPGALRRALGTPPGENIPYSDLVWAARQPGLMGQRGRLALELRGFQKGRH